MGLNVVDDKISRGAIFLSLLKLCFKRPSLFKRALKSVYVEGKLLESRIPKASLKEIIHGKSSVILQDAFLKKGNLFSLYELNAICSLASYFNPKNLLEIGTFDGNTTLQLALNTAKNTTIHTLDLEEGITKMPTSRCDLPYIQNQEKKVRKFQNTEVAYKITQHIGDSTAYDFELFTKEGPLDFIFIDAGHSYACVKSDTENAFKVLSDQGIILWHDYIPWCKGVYSYLNELSLTHTLLHIQDTTLVLYARAR